MAHEVSIGMPVYNGARFLRPTLDSLLAQTFSDFELIISDNASTDATEDICREYAKQDGRIRYIRQTENKGAVFNWNFVAQSATGRYFKWASSNDRCHATLIEKCITALRIDSSLVLAYPRTTLIDDNDAVLGAYDKDPEILDTLPSTRFLHAVSKLELNNAQCGLIRLDTLRKTRGERNYPAGDIVLMAELALHGGFRLIQEYLFFRRMDQDSSARYLSQTDLVQFLRPQGGGMALPRWRKFGDYYWSLLRTPIGMPDRTRGLIAVTRRMLWERGALVEELVQLTGLRR